MGSGMTNKAYFRRDSTTLIPLPISRGYWSEDSIQGRAVVGLIGQEIERRHGGEGLIPARLTVDMHRLARMRPVDITTSVIRDGGRLRLVEAVLSSDGIEYARAQCQFLRATEPPPGRVWAGGEPWDAPAPDMLSTVTDPHSKLHAEWRLIKGHVGAFGPRQLWIRDHFTVVEGEALSPFGRVALVADFASPWLHACEKGIFYINTDVTVQLHRLPVSEWLGFDATIHDASQGIAVGQCRLYDETGSIGLIAVTALTNQRG